MDDFKKITFQKCVGFGGMKCTCCGPKPGMERKKMRRQARHILKSMDRREFNRIKLIYEDKKYP